MVATMPNVTDQAVENAKYQLRICQAHLRQAESAVYCCDHSEKAAVSKARKQVKRWETWLADREILAGDAEDDSDDDEE